MATEWIDSAARAEILGLLSNMLDAQNAGFIVAVTWAEANALTPANKTGVKIYGPDTGTHTDAAGTTNVPNTGTFQYRTGAPAGLYRIGELELLPPIRFTMGTVTDSNPMFEASQTWNDGLLPGDGGRSSFHGFTQKCTVNNVNKLFDNGVHTLHRWMVNDLSVVEIGTPTKGTFTGGIFPPQVKIIDRQVASGKSFGSINYASGLFNLCQGIDFNIGTPNPVISLGFDDFNTTTGSGTSANPTVAILASNATNRLQIQAVGAVVIRSDLGRVEIESPAGTDTRIPIVGYYTADGKILDFINSGQPQPRTPVSFTTISTNADIALIGTKIGNLTRVNLGKIGPDAQLYVPGLFIGASIGAETMSGASAVSAVTNGDVRLIRSAASVLKIDDGAGGFGTVRGKLSTHVAATMGAVTADRYLTLYDNAGTAHKVPCSL